jgi:hypothetical protein
MALVATVGAATSNSYVTQAEATTYFASGMHELNATWTALDSDGKDEYLIKATLQIEAQRLRGEKNDTSTTSGAPDQRLHFPRSTDVDGSTEFIPLDIKIACYEQAIWLAYAPPVSNVRTALQREGVTAAEAVVTQQGLH